MAVKTKEGIYMLQEGLVIGDGPEYELTLNGKNIRHKMRYDFTINGILESQLESESPDLSRLRDGYALHIWSGTVLAEMRWGQEDFGVWDVVTPGAKKTLNIVWNKKLTRASREYITFLYEETFFPDETSEKADGF